MLEVVIVLNFVCLMLGRLGNLETAHFFLKLGLMVLTLSK
jgi:hypothetical protein